MTEQVTLNVLPNHCSELKSESRPFHFICRHTTAWHYSLIGLLYINGGKQKQHFKHDFHVNGAHMATRSHLVYQWEWQKCPEAGWHLAWPPSWSHAEPMLMTCHWMARLGQNWFRLWQREDSSQSFDLVSHTFDCFLRVPQWYEDTIA